MVVYSTRRCGNGRPNSRSTSAMTMCPPSSTGIGKQVDDGQVDVKQHEEAQREPPIRVHVGGQQSKNARRAAQVLQADAGLLGVGQRGEGADRAVHDRGRSEPRGGYARCGKPACPAPISAPIRPTLALVSRRGVTFRVGSLAVTLDDDVLGLAGAFLDEADELLGAVQRDLGEHQDFIACLQPRRLRRAVGQ